MITEDQRNLGRAIVSYLNKDCPATLQLLSEISFESDTDQYYETRLYQYLALRKLNRNVEANEVLGQMREFCRHSSETDLYMSLLAGEICINFSDYALAQSISDEGGNSEDPYVIARSNAIQQIKRIDSVSDNFDQLMDAIRLYPTIDSLLDWILKSVMDGLQNQNQKRAFLSVLKSMKTRLGEGYEEAMNQYINAANSATVLP